MREISVGRNLTANTLTTLYTVPTQQTAKWIYTFVHNGGNTTKHISVWWYDKSANTEIVTLLEYPITSKLYFERNGNAYLFLEEGDEIRVKSETNSTISIMITVEQSYKQTTQHGF